jgi:peptidoglycan hydrolase CwlO-like protein
MTRKKRQTRQQTKDDLSNMAAKAERAASRADRLQQENTSLQERIVALEPQVTVAKQDVANRDAIMPQLVLTARLSSSSSVSNLFHP